MKDVEKARNTQVVILCGGRGVRLQPITDEIPKPLVYLRDQPMIKHILDIFAVWGFNRFCLCLGYRGFMIRDYFEGKNLPYLIEYDDAGEDASMLKRVLNARRILTGDRFILSFGDAIADVNLHDLLEFHERSDSLLTMTVRRLHSSFGILKFNDRGQVSSFREKPLLDEWMNIGFMVVEKSVLDLVDEAESIVDLYDKVIAMGRFWAFRHEGEHLTVNTKEEKIDTEARLEGFYTILSGTMGDTE